MATNLTPAQRRALEWLPADGNWDRPHREALRGLANLARWHPNLVEVRIATYVGVPGKHKNYRLTADGVAERERGDV